MSVEKLKQRVDEKIQEIENDYQEFYRNLLKRDKIETAEQLCNESTIFTLAFAWEISQYLINSLENETEGQVYDELKEKWVLVLEISNVFKELMNWYGDEEYTPNFSSWSFIDEWILDALETIQEQEDEYHNGNTENDKLKSGKDEEM